MWWKMLDGDLFQLRVASTEALIQEGIFRTSLFLFYRLHHEENPEEEFSTLGDLSEETFGQRSGSQSLKCKGAGTRILVPLTIWLFEKTMEPWASCPWVWEALEGMVNTVRAAPTNMSNAEVQMVHDVLQRHFRAMDLLDIGRVLQHHLCANPLHGNPRTYVLILDEAINGKLKKIRCGLPRRGLLQAPPCGVPHRARPSAEGRGILDRLKRRRAHWFFGTDFSLALSAEFSANTQRTRESHTPHMHATMPPPRTTTTTSQHH